MQSEIKVLFVQASESESLRYKNTVIELTSELGGDTNWELQCSM